MNEWAIGFLVSFTCIELGFCQYSGVVHLHGVWLRLHGLSTNFPLNSAFRNAWLDGLGCASFFVTLNNNTAMYKYYYKEAYRNLGF